MNRAEWLEWRRDGLGGSDIAAIQAGRSWSVWLSKTQGIDDDLAGEAIETGRRLEAVIGKWAARELDIIFLANGGNHVGAEPWMRGSPDYFGVLRPVQPSIGVECKVSEWPWHDEIPAGYVAQVRWYMAVCDIDRWVIAAFHRCAPAWRLYEVKRDLELEERLVAFARGWWEKHVVGGVEPDVDGSREAARGLRILRDLPEDRGGRAGGLVAATEAEVELVREYIDTDTVAKELIAERDLLRNRVRAAVGNRPGLRWTGGRIKVGRTGIVTHKTEPT